MPYKSVLHSNSRTDIISHYLTSFIRLSLNCDQISEQRSLKDGQGQLDSTPSNLYAAGYLESEFTALFDDEWEAIDVGTNKDLAYYAREYLRIVSYKICSGILPDKLVDEMLDHVVHALGKSRELIEAEDIRSVETQSGKSNLDLVSRTAHKFTDDPLM
ncbi:hypothetical protein IAQ61_007641 [Plenodomus lingam]|uniref:uncharacterized protein n=1 Tax=Leptosphaeria maculans TaxID=5022 RepID=UPI00332F452D|nr:hypothetical protein IAQ61_007641 [Plenodomus lingam]